MLKSAGLESGSPKPQEQEEEPPQGLKGSRHWWDLSLSLRNEARLEKKSKHLKQRCHNQRELFF